MTPLVISAPRRGHFSLSSGPKRRAARAGARPRRPSRIPRPLLPPPAPLLSPRLVCLLSSLSLVSSPAPPAPSLCSPQPSLSSPAPSAPDLEEEEGGGVWRRKRRSGRPSGGSTDARSDECLSDSSLHPRHQPPSSSPPWPAEAGKEETTARALELKGGVGSQGQSCTLELRGTRVICSLLISLLACSFPTCCSCLASQPQVLPTVRSGRARRLSSQPEPEWRTLVCRVMCRAHGEPAQ